VRAEWLQRRFGAEVLWLPFDLHPEYPPEGIERQRRGGHAEEMFAASGLAYNPPPDHVPNTQRALRLNELARELGLHGPFHDRLMDAYWDEATDIGDPAELRRLAAEVGLPAQRVEDVLAGDEFAEEVAGSTAQAHALGINGIPAFLLDRRLLVLGAHPEETFERAFAQLAGTA
jgi:predicted DsbA family dithiol-disulfide isomerase